MKKSLAALVVAVAVTASAPAFAVIVATFTGLQEQVQTVTGQIALRCQYDYFGQKFYRIFKVQCPSSIEVE